MSEVVTFSGFTPPPRYDNLPWTEVRIEESIAEGGPWTQIDTVALSPLDADPSMPAERAFTTELGTALDYWYRVIFADLSGDISQPTSPLQNTAVAAGGPLPVAESVSTEICSLWASAADVTDCCADLAITDQVTLELLIQQASELLYRLSGYRYAGLCSATVRPCASYLSCWYGVAEWHASDCSCVRLSHVRLAGYPVDSITEVLIDDVVIDPSEYRLEHGRELVRLADADGRAQTWPTCQRRDLDSGEGTFFITYTYGQNPPIAGVRAAAQLACELAKQCPGATGTDLEAECALPTGTVRIARQGITIDTQALGVWLLGVQQTGMAFVDTFLSGYGQGRRRRAALLVPEADPWPVRVG